MEGSGYLVQVLHPLSRHSRQRLLNLPQLPALFDKFIREGELPALP